MFSISTDDLTTVRSFDQAAGHYGKTRPFKDSEDRPLAGRRKKHMFLRKECDGSYSCVLYRTVMARYFQDGTVWVSTHDSISSWKFLNYVVPEGLSCTSVGGCTTLVVPHQTTFWYYRARGSSVLKLKRIHTFWVLLNPEDCLPFTKTSVDPERARVIREYAKPYREWAKVVARLGGQPKPYGRSLNYIDFNLDVPLTMDDFGAIFDAVGGNHPKLLSYLYRQFKGYKETPLPVGLIRPSV